MASRTQIAIALAPLCLTVLVAALDARLIATLQPAVIASLGPTSPCAPWLAQAHVIAQLAVGPLAGNASDVFGRLGALFFGVVLFCAGSLGNALAQSWPAMLVGRVLEGAGAAFMTTGGRIRSSDTGI